MTKKLPEHAITFYIFLLKDLYTFLCILPKEKNYLSTETQQFSFS